MQILIRKAAPNETSVAKACVVSAFNQYIERMGKPPAPMLLDFAAEIEKERIWLADASGRVAGVLVQYATENGFYIDTLAVSPHFQGAGAGRALLQFAEQEAVRRGYASIYLCTNIKMIENQAFYPHMGYVEYERKVDDGYERVFYRKHLPAGSSDTDQ